MNNEAYIEGFCKTAEKYGVDPVELIKSAGIPVGLMKSFPNLVKQVATGTPRKNWLGSLSRQASGYQRNLPILSGFSSDYHTDLRKIRAESIVQRLMDRVENMDNIKNLSRNTIPDGKFGNRIYDQANDYVNSRNKLIQKLETMYGDSSKDIHTLVSDYNSKRPYFSDLTTSRDFYNHR